MILSSVVCYCNYETSYANDICKRNYLATARSADLNGNERNHERR